MYRLICTSGMNKGQEYDLPESCELTLGRSQNNSICVFDKKSSRVHCKLLINKDVFAVEDLNSTNGLTVNDEFVKGKVQIKSGDRIGIGQTVFIIVPADAKDSAPQGMDEADQKKFQNLVQTSFQVTKTTALRKMKAEQAGKGEGFLSFFKTKENKKD